jgi:hypothetical protein
VPSIVQPAKLIGVVVSANHNVSVVGFFACLSLALTMAKEKTRKWNKGDDKKLAELFRRGRKDQGVNSQDLSKEYIQKVIEKFYPERNYKSFAPLFRTKARAYNLGQSLAGARRGTSDVSQLL